MIFLGSLQARRHLQGGLTQVNPEASLGTLLSQLYTSTCSSGVASPGILDRWQLHKINVLQHIPLYVSAHCSLLNGGEKLYEKNSFLLLISV